MSKFGGKFRREQDYSDDDFKTSRNLYNERKRKSQLAEQKKERMRRYHEDEYDDEYEYGYQRK